MGTQFFWVYDIAMVAVIVGIVFKGLKKGFLASILGFLAIVIAFIAALYLSEGMADFVYTHWFEQNLKEQVSVNLDDTIGDNSLLSLSDAKLDKIKIGGKSISEISKTPDTAGRIEIEASSVDLSKTGLQDADLSLFGITGTTDISSINAGVIQISETELLQHDFESIVLAKTLVSTMSSGTFYGQLKSLAEQITAIAPQLFGNNSSAGSESTLMTDLILKLMDASPKNITDGIFEQIVEPVILIPIRILIFIILFAIISIILGFVSKLLKFVNKVPLVGSVNALLGGVVGLLEAVIVLLLVCICVQFVISITNNTLVFLNTMTVNKTILFKYIYHFDPINFIGGVI